MQRIIVSVLFLLLAPLTQAQDKPPHLKGQVTLSISKGTIVCDFTMSNIPRIEDYVIRINSGMNIHFFKNPEWGNLLHYELDSKDTTAFGESLAYYFPGQKKASKFLPQELQLRYMGMYPVINDTAGEMSVSDWRGNVAFNGQSLRVDGYQSAWYPILYDKKNQQLYEELTYDVNVTCSDCSSLYVNGSRPQKGPTANFKSETPQQLTLFCGNYDFTNMDGLFILNPEMNEAQLQDFSSIITSYKSYYEKKLGLPYDGHVSFIQTTPTARDYGFLFVSYPTIINVGAGENALRTLFDAQKGLIYRPFIAHELGHYYFGKLLRTNSVFGPVLNEGFTEFLSLKVTKHVISDSIYNKKIKDKMNALKGFKAAPFAAIKIPADFEVRELYVYYYAPLILLAIEKEIGEENMWKWLSIMLKTKTAFTDYGFLEKTLADSLKDKNKLMLVKEKYFTAEAALENALETIVQTPMTTKHQPR